MIVVVLAAAVLASPMAVQGSGECPSPTQVAAALSGVSAAGADGETDTAFVVTDGADVVITLRGPDGTARLTRRIARVEGSPPNCAAAPGSTRCYPSWPTGSTGTGRAGPARSRPARRRPGG